MNLHKHILQYLTFLTIYFHKSSSTRNKNLVLVKSGIEDVSPCSVGLQFFSTVNNTSVEDYFVELLADECCIDFGVNLDCESFEIIGESAEVIEKGSVKTFRLVAPVLDPFERKGYCVIHLDSRPIDKRNNIMRDNIKIDFNTEIKKEDITSTTEETIKKCKNIDEDPFNDCKPVNCDTHYNGKKPVYDKNSKRCIKVPKCKNKTDVNRVYDPLTNRCIDGDAIDNDDIDFIKSLTKERHPKDVIIVESSDVPTFNATRFNTDLFQTKVPAIEVQNRFCGSIIRYLTANKYTLLVLGMVIFVQCCLICTMFYCLTKRSMFCDRKKVERKYFNYRQDVSVTTPLIGTSNMDTETTAFDYISESSNIDKKIKCYKACQKERKNDPKMSMSDDILSKCLNRRDWNVKPKPDTNKDVVYDNPNFDWNNSKSNIQQTIPEQGANKTKENEKKESNKEKQDDYRTRIIKEDYNDSDSSEKLIQSHDYNTNSRKNIAGSEKALNIVATSISTGKGAQACFSNDSIDDFLSERGIIYLAGEGMSKYSLPSNSTPSLSTNMSCKTSKNNLIKNVLSYLSRKSKICTSSDPGLKDKKNKAKGKDLELIHMSRASMYSSSASDYRNLQGAKFAKDSRSSF